MKDDDSYSNESTSSQSMSKITVCNHSQIKSPSFLSKIEEYHVAEVHETKEEVRRPVSKKVFEKAF